MAFEQKDMSGTLFVNNRKETDNHPDFSGSAKINGVDYWISAWAKTGPKGPFTSLAFKRKDGPEPVKVLAMKAQAPVDLGDDVPFEFQWK